METQWLVLVERERAHIYATEQEARAYAHKANEADPDLELRVVSVALVAEWAQDERS